MSFLTIMFFFVLLSYSVVNDWMLTLPKNPPPPHLLQCAGTCGTAKLLLAVPRILELAEELSLPLAAVKYSRGTFMFPDAQPSPHKYFADEVSCLLEPLLWGSQVWWQRLCGWRCCKTWPEMARLLCHRVPRRRQACGHS
jgi:hypothetical protein